MFYREAANSGMGWSRALVSSPATAHPQSVGPPYSTRRPGVKANSVGAATNETQRRRDSLRDAEKGERKGPSSVLSIWLRHCRAALLAFSLRFSGHSITAGSRIRCIGTCPRLRQWPALITLRESWRPFREFASRDGSSPAAGWGAGLAPRSQC